MHRRSLEVARREAAGEQDRRRLIEHLLETELDDDWYELLCEELGAPGEDPRAPSWHKDQLAPGRPFRVAIVGAGMSGLVAAHRLAQAGIDHVVFEKNADVGGTWFENRYPGCRVDVPNHMYSYSFFQRGDWPASFTPGKVLLDYFRDCADELGVRGAIRFGTEVVAARFRDDELDWELQLGTGEVAHVDAVVSAVGQLNRPHLPAIDGRDSFAGISVHSAAWPAALSVRGERVAVVGTAASAIQLIPEVAAEAAEVHVYQRTPNWFMPTPDYHRVTDDETLEMHRRLPGYGRFYRLWLFWRLSEGLLPAARIDPEWPQDGRSVSAASDALRQVLTDYLVNEFGSTPELLDAMLPAYPPLAKRILLDDGTWAATLKQEHVELVTDPIERVDATGIVAGGRLRPVDVIVYATGFHASEFLVPMRVTGAGGVDLHEQWAGDARAYLGMTVPKFPNFFCLYGPNTNLVANGSIIFFSECEVRYILGCIELLLRQGGQVLDCRPEVHDAYNAGVDAANATMAWGATDVHSWYRSASGRVSQNWPYSLLEFWRRTRTVDAADYRLG